MGEQLKKCNTRATKLFVAGIPSGVHPTAVLNFFKQFGSLEICSSSLGQDRSSRGKGYCHLLSMNPRETARIVDTRFFKFMGRTLTVTENKSGAQLIIESKRLNKCSVIFKKIPSYVDEVEFERQLVSYGFEVDTLFQYKPVAPPGVDQRNGALVSFRGSVFSVNFKKKHVAQMIIKDEHLALSDGSMVKAEPFLKGKSAPAKKNPALNTSLEEKIMKEDIPAAKRRNKRKDSRTGETKLFQSGNGLNKRSYPTFSYQTKPTSAAYEVARRSARLKQVSDISYRENLKFNFQGSKTKENRTLIRTAYGAVLVKSQ